MWSYRELFSCPFTLILGSYEYLDLKGYVVMSVLNYRLNLLVSQSGEIRVLSNIPQASWRDFTFKLCSAIATNKLSDLYTVDLVRAYSMFYSGICSFLIYGNNILPVTIDFVNTEKYYFYLEPYTGVSTSILNTSRGKLEDWIIFQTALRSGEFDLLIKACKNLEPSSVSSEECNIRSDCGVLKITKRKLEISSYLRIIPDNTPLRHIVVLENKTSHLRVGDTSCEIIY